MSVIDEREEVQPEPDTLGAFVTAHEGQFRIEVLQREARIMRVEDLDGLPLAERYRTVAERYIRSNSVLGGGSATVRVSYEGGGVIVIEVDLFPAIYPVTTVGSHATHLAFSDDGLEQPTLWSVLSDLLRGVREIEVISRASKEVWEEIFGVDDEDESRALYELRQKEVQDAKALLGSDYSEFVTVVDYDDNYLWMAGLAPLVMPKVGTRDGEEIVVVNWLKQEGDDCVAQETVLEVDTDKARVAVTSPVGGWLYKILVSQGDAVPVGTPLAYIALLDDEDGSDTSLDEE